MIGDLSLLFVRLIADDRLTCDCSLILDGRRRLPCTEWIADVSTSISSMNDALSYAAFIADAAC